MESKKYGKNELADRVLGLLEASSLPIKAINIDTDLTQEFGGRDWTVETTVTIKMIGDLKLISKTETE